MQLYYFSSQRYSRKVCLFTWNLISAPIGVFEPISFHVDIWAQDIWKAKEPVQNYPKETHHSGSCRTNKGWSSGCCSDLARGTSAIIPAQALRILNSLPLSYSLTSWWTRDPIYYVWFWDTFFCLIRQEDSQDRWTEPFHQLGQHSGFVSFSCL